MGEEKMKTELTLNQGALRAICGAMPSKPDIRFYLDGFLLDVHPDGERLIAVATNGHIIALGAVSEPSVENVASFVHFRQAREEMRTAREDTAEADAKAKGSRYCRNPVYENIIVCPDRVKLPPGKADDYGAPCTLTLDTEGAGVATLVNRSMAAVTLSDGKFPEYGRVCPWPLWTDGAPGDGWELGADCGLNVGYLHRIWPEGWAVYHRPAESQGILFCRPIGSGAPQVQVGLMGMRL
jgi:hypothetical protein